MRHILLMTHRVWSELSFARNGLGFFQRTFTWYPRYALPLLPHVAFVHQLMNAALKDSEKHLSKDFTEEFSKLLGDIRSIHWNALEHSHLNRTTFSIGQSLLERLLDYETNLPQPFLRSLSTLANKDVKSIFDDVRDSIEHLKFHQENASFEAFRPSTK